MGADAWVDRVVLSPRIFCPGLTSMAVLSTSLSSHSRAFGFRTMCMGCRGPRPLLLGIYPVANGLSPIARDPIECESALCRKYLSCDDNLVRLIFCHQFQISEDARSDRTGNWLEHTPRLTCCRGL